MAKKTIAELQLKGSGGKQVAGQLDQVGKATERVGRQQTRLGQASASAGRAFAAQATGLGGLVSAYAGAAATVFAITAAFQALNQAAQTAQVVEGLNALATTVGTTGSSILRSSQEVTRGLVSIRETAESVNIGLSAGFNQDQILQLQKVSLGASRALGRTLTDALTRVTRGAAKLEPELLDELGIFVKIDPAVEAYAAKLNKTASSLTDFERRQAFVNAIIEQGTQKFSIIDTTSGNALESLQRLSTVIIDLGAKVGAVLANAITPFADYISGDLGNTLAVFGILANTVFGSALRIARESINKTTASVEAFGNSLGERFARNAEAQGIAFGNLEKRIQGLDLRTVQGTRSQQRFARELIRSAKNGTLAVQDLDKLQKVLQRVETRTDLTSKQFKIVENSLKAVTAAQNTTGKAAQRLAIAFSFLGKAARVLGSGLTIVLGALTRLISIVSIARLVLKPFTDALGITDEIDAFAKSLFQTALNILGVNDASRAAQKGVEGLASSLLSANEQFAELPDKVLLTQQSFFRLSDVTREFTKQELAKEFTELLKNIGDTDAIDDFTDKFRGASFEGQAAIGILIEEAIRFQNIFGNTAESASAALGAIASETGVAAKVLADFITLQERAGQGFGEITKFTRQRGNRNDPGGQQNLGTTTATNIELAESGRLINLQIADTERIVALLKEQASLRKQGNIQGAEAISREIETLRINQSILGFLAKEEKFRAEIAEGKLTGEQISREEASLQTVLNDLLDRSGKLRSGELLILLNLLDVNRKLLKNDVERQTQQDLLNKRLRKDFQSQISAAGKLNGLASLSGQIASNEAEIKANQLEVVGAILKIGEKTVKEEQLKETSIKIANGLIADQLKNIRKIREEQEKQVRALTSQLNILRQTTKVKDSQRELKSLQQEISLGDKIQSNNEALIKQEREIAKMIRGEKIAALEDEFDLQRKLLDQRSDLFSEGTLKELKLEIDKAALESLRAETEKQKADRLKQLDREINALDTKTKNDLMILDAQEKIAAEQFQLERVKIDQDKLRFDFEQKIRDQRIKELVAQDDIFKSFLKEFALLISTLSADIKMATDEDVKTRLAAGESAAAVRADKIDEGVKAILPNLSKALNVDGLKESQAEIKTIFGNIETLRREEAAKDFQSTKDLLEAKRNFTEEVESQEILKAANAASMDIMSLDNKVAATERAVTAQERLNQTLTIGEITLGAFAQNLSQGFEQSLMSLNEELINGTITMNSIGNTFSDMLGNMLRSVQQQVFQESIAKPIASGITSFIGGLFNSGGPVHLAGGGALKRDRIPAMLEPGEFVIRKEAAKKLGMTKLQELNAGIRPDPMAMLIARLGGSKVQRLVPGGMGKGDPGVGTAGQHAGTSAAGPGSDGPPGQQGGKTTAQSVQDMVNAAARASLGRRAGRSQAPTDLTGGLFGKSTSERAMANPTQDQLDQIGIDAKARDDAKAARDAEFAARNKAVAKAVIGLGLNLAVPAQFGKIAGFANTTAGLFGKDVGSQVTGQQGITGQVGQALGLQDDEEGEMASGGLVHMAAGGTMKRDRVPALLEPGEFVIRKPMAKAIGGAALGQMNSTGKMTPGDVSVNINNSGSPKDVSVGTPKFNGDKYVIDIVTRDLRNNGALRKSLRGGSAG